MCLSLADVALQRDDLQLGVREHDVPRRKELQEQPELPVGELYLNDAVRADLRHARDPSRLEELAEPLHERRRRGRGGSCERGEVATEAAVDEELLAVVRFVQLYEEDAGREVEDV